jgi:hypothetical protein
MKTLQKTIILLLFCTTTLYLSAQAPTESQFIAARNHSIGINLYPLIAHLIENERLASFSAFEITYKYQLKGKDRAWRFGLLGQHQYYNQDGNINQPYEELFRTIDYETTQKQFKIGAYAGHEWQWTLGKRWLLATGADVRYLYEQRNEWNAQSIQTSPGSYIEDNGNYYSHGVSLQPFVGLNFAITSHWLLYIDVKVDFTYDHITKDYEDSHQIPTRKSSSNSTEYRFNFLPFQQINIIYTF